MIPHQLQIKNFLSYGPETQTINFGHYHLICLSGKNGHGKSALLDAITWAIWGQARKTSMSSKPDAGLLHLGQKHMMVILEFEVNGQQYRIRREFINTASKPFASLDFGIKNTEGKLVPLTDKTIKDTQEKIEKMIGITYDSFINSTFLRQGQSNEFSKKSPKERKEILAQILQLQQFEQQKKIALAHTKKLQQDWLLQDNITKRIQQELSTMVTLQESYQQVLNDIHNIHHQKVQLHHDQQALEQQEQTLQQKINKKNILQQQHTELQKKLQEHDQELQTIQHTLQQYQASDLETLQKTEQQLITDLTNLQKIQQKRLQLKEQYLTTKEKLNEWLTQQQQTYQTQHQALTVQIAQIQQELKFTQQQHQAEFKKYHAVKDECTSMQQEIQKTEQTIQPLLHAQQELQNLQEQFDKEKQHFQTQQAISTQIIDQIDQYQQTAQALHNNTQKHCSVCLQSINDQQKTIIIDHVQNQIIISKQKSTEVQTNIATCKQDLIKKHQTIKQLQEGSKRYIEQKTYLQEQEKMYTKLQKNCQEHDDAIKILQQTITQQETTISNITKTLQTLEQEHEKSLQRSEILALQDTLKSYEQQAKQLILPNNALEKTQQDLQTIQQKLHHAKNNNLHTNQATLSSQAETLKKQILEIQKQICTHDTELLLLQFIELEQKKLMIQKQNHQQACTLLDQRTQTVLVQKGTLEQAQKKQKELETELKSLQKTMQELHQEITDFQDIAKALGKDGVQALLIEQAIPEIEHETNQILARLTNNQTQIFIESLRDLKKGGSKETLDIKISDSFGLRDYEMFSGGEAFRIDFALRIGISKLLARRAGTTLQTIFIDEGFGSQDEEGLQLIMDNIYKIQNDFAKIIVVSHLPEMKEQFPVQFMIEKKRSGSTVSIIEHG